MRVEMLAMPELEAMRVLPRGCRLSIAAVTKPEFSAMHAAGMRK